MSLATAAVSAPSLHSYVGVLSSHDLLWPNTYGIASQYSSTGAFVSTSGGEEFTGLDRDGNQRSSYFEGGGTAHAQYGQLKASTWGSLTNSFYNPENAENDLPNIYATFGQVNFKDTLKFAGMFILPTFKVRYTYFVHGQLEGSHSYAALSVSVGENSDSLYIDGSTGNTIAQYFTTDLFELNPNLEHGLQTNFLAGFQVDTKGLADGTDVSGAGNFGSTVTLTSIEMFDANGNAFYDFTVLSDSGTIYPTAAVPEPATLAALGLGIATLVRRRKQSR